VRNQTQVKSFFADMEKKAARRRLIWLLWSRKASREIVAAVFFLKPPQAL
jgi:hypothetical protein